MEIYNESQSGWPNEVVSTLIQRVSAYTRSGVGFKIGITANPYAKADQYDFSEPWYEEMILIYRTSSIDFVRQLEAALIDRYEGFCDNSIGGGGIGEPPYYLYIVRE